MLVCSVIGLEHLESDRNFCRNRNTRLQSISIKTEIKIKNRETFKKPKCIDMPIYHINFLHKYHNLLK